MGSVRGAWIDVDLDKLQNNMNMIRELMKKDTGREIIPMFVAKAQCYGHGIFEVVEAMSEIGIEWFGVAAYSEARIVQAAVPDAKILVLGYVPIAYYDDMVRHGIRTTVYSMEQAEALSKEAVRQGKDAFVHIKIDTGMHRLGFQPCEESADIIKEISKLPGLVMEGMFTHFATSAMAFGQEKKKFVDVQFARFEMMEKLLEERGVDIAYKHISNGGIIIDHPQYHKDMARIGSPCYATYTTDGVRKDRIFPEVAFQLRAEIATVNEIGPGEGIGYDHTFTTQRQSRIATLPIGYGDMGIRKLKNNGYVLVKGQKAPIVGGICMDQMMIDVTDIEGVKMGDVATIIGESEGEVLSLAEVSSWIGTDDYEVTVSSQMRLPKRYWKNGKMFKTVDIGCIIAEYFTEYGRMDRVVPGAE